MHQLQGWRAKHSLLDPEHVLYTDSFRFLQAPLHSGDHTAVIDVERDRRPPFLPLEESEHWPTTLCSCYGCKPIEKSVIIGGQAKKWSQFPHSVWDGPVLHHWGLLRVSPHAFSRDCVSKVAHLGLKELTLLQENILMENLLHEPLECGGSIAQPTGHPEELKQPKGICECSLMAVTFIHRNLVEGRLQVNHREISSSMQSMHVLLDSG